MSASTMQKPNTNQVICGQCGKWTDFDNDRCPFCGASLYGDEPQKYGEEPQNDSESNEKDNEKDESGEQNPQKDDEVSKPAHPKEDDKTNEQKKTELSRSHTSKIIHLFKGVKEWCKYNYAVLIVVLGIPLIYVLYFVLLFFLDYIGYFKAL